MYGRLGLTRTLPIMTVRTMTLMDYRHRVRLICTLFRQPGRDDRHLSTVRRYEKSQSGVTLIRGHPWIKTRLGLFGHISVVGLLVLQLSLIHI